MTFYSSLTIPLRSLGLSASERLSSVFIPQRSTSWPLQVWPYVNQAPFLQRSQSGGGGQHEEVVPCCTRPRAMMEGLAESWGCPWERALTAPAQERGGGLGGLWGGEVTAGP